MTECLGGSSDPPVTERRMPLLPGSVPEYPAWAHYTGVKGTRTVDAYVTRIGGRLFEATFVDDSTLIVQRIKMYGGELVLDGELFEQDAESRDEARGRFLEEIRHELPALIMMEEL